MCNSGGLFISCPRPLLKERYIIGSRFGALSASLAVVCSTRRVEIRFKGNRTVGRSVLSSSEVKHFRSLGIESAQLLEKQKKKNNFFR